jgi:hypothetical protein
MVDINADFCQTIGVSTKGGTTRAWLDPVLRRRGVTLTGSEGDFRGLAYAHFSGRVARLLRQLEKEELAWL